MTEEKEAKKSEESAAPEERWTDQEKRFLAAVAKSFAAGGVLQKNLPSFVPRKSQTELALEVAKTILRKGTFIAEAGTGTGKTFAYLVPALLSGIRVMVTTAGKPLQDQLYTKDLPLILRALGLHADTVLLKGRSNYICKKRLEEVDMVPTKEDINYLRDIQIFSEASESGDRAELKHIPENAQIWPLVTSTHENCPGANCPAYDGCFLTRARREAKEADILVVNHHLFLSSLAISGEGAAEEILPDMPLIVIDEAHQLPGIATDFFGDVFSTSSAMDLAHDALHLGKVKAPDGADWDSVTREVDLAAKEIGVAVVTHLRMEEGDRRVVTDIPDFGSLAPYFERLEHALGTLEAALTANAGRDTDLDLLIPRCETMLGQVCAWEEIMTEEGAKPGDEKGAEEDPGVNKAIPEEIKSEEAPHVHWLLVGRASVRFFDTPLSFADKFRELRQAKGGAWLFTSATLSVAQDFTHYKKEIGLPESGTGTWSSPFDYFSQAALYLPPDLPDPNSPDFSRAVADSAWPFVKKAGGRTLFLCTSLRAVDAVADRLEVLAASEHADLSVLRQGTGTRKGLLEKFRSENGTVLVGSMSFWEGIDIKGDALSVVVIDRIPFSPPDDPVMSSRCNWVKERGGRPFFEIQVPEAVTLLRQGAGRLIRSEKDRGVLVFCDNRVISKWSSYGQTIVRSLPDFCRTQKLERALAFVPERTVEKNVKTVRAAKKKRTK